MTLNKNWSRESGEERTEEYRTWRTTLGVGAVGDIDQVEYDSRTGRPLAVIELSVADMQDDSHPGGVRAGHNPSNAFFESVEKGKLSERRGQGRMLRYIAKIFNVPLIRVVFIKGHLDRLWAWSDKRERREYSLEEFRTILENMHTK